MYNELFIIHGQVSIRTKYLAISQILFGTDPCPFKGYGQSSSSTPLDLSSSPVITWGAFILFELSKANKKSNERV